MVWNNFFFYENSRPAESLNSREMRFQRQNRLQRILSRCPPSGTTDMPKGHVLSLPATHTHARERYREEAGLGWGSTLPSPLPTRSPGRAAQGARSQDRPLEEAVLGRKGQPDQPHPELRRPRRQPGTLPGHELPAQPTAEDTCPGAGEGGCVCLVPPQGSQQLVVLFQDTLPLVLLPM